MSSKSLSSRVYDFDNVGEFSNLFEHEKMLADFVLVDSRQICLLIAAA